MNAELLTPPNSEGNSYNGELLVFRIAAKGAFRHHLLHCIQLI